MTTQTAGTLQITRVIAADPETVFDAWTQPEHIKKWSAPEGMDIPISEVDLTVGGRFHLQMRNAEGGTHNARGIYRVIDRPSRLVYSWAWDEHPDQGESLIAVEFAAVAGGTEITMIHSGLPSEESATEHEHGWASCLNRLVALYA
jgi:glutathione S-transferase